MEDDRIKRLFMNGHELILEEDQEVGQFFEEKARKELRETDETKEVGLAELRKLIEEDGNINVPVDDDIFLLPFLRSCKFYPESAFKKLVDTYAFKDRNPKYCRNLVPSKEGNAFEHNIFTVFPYRDQHGRRILLIEAGKKWNTKEVSLTEIVRGIMLIVEAALLEPKTQIAGSVILIDLNGLSLTHVWQFTPNLAKLILEYVQECVPLRVKAIHLLNQPYVFNMLYAIFKPFIGEKLRKRIFFHGDNFGGLLEQVDAKFIPTQYGGEMKLETIYGPQLHKLICQFEQEFIEGNSRGFKNKKK